MGSGAVEPVFRGVSGGARRSSDCLICLLSPACRLWLPWHRGVLCVLSTPFLGALVQSQGFSYHQYAHDFPTDLSSAGLSPEPRAPISSCTLSFSSWKPKKGLGHEQNHTPGLPTFLPQPLHVGNWQNPSPCLKSQNIGSIPDSCFSRLISRSISKSS